MKASHAMRASLLALSPWLCAHALALPALQEPQLQPLMAAASADYRAHLANPSALSRPQNAIAWPCEVSQAELDVFADTVDSDQDPVAKAELIHDARSSGLAPSKLIYTDKVVTPVRAQCEGGKLSGPLEFWIEYREALSSAQFNIKHHRLVRVRGQALQGAPEGMVLLTGTVLSQDTDYLDPATARMMAAQPKPKTEVQTFSAFAPAGQAPKKAVTISHIRVNGELTVSTVTRFSRADGQVVEDSYGSFGGPAHHTFRKLRRNGKLHGPQQTFAGMMGQFPIPASTDCFQDGEKVLTNHCPAD